jgi:putative transposase
MRQVLTRCLRTSGEAYAEPLARQRRIDIPDATHHIAALAVDKESVFREPADRRRLLVQLEAIVECYGWRCRAYCLMGTHFHLVVQTPEPTLSRGMQHLCGSYAQWFNWKYARRGHLFARRFASVHVVSDSHLLEAHRYVALNPVRAGLCRTPAAWSWGSFRAIAGLEPAPGFLDVEGVLGLFDVRRGEAQSAFRSFVETAGPDDESVPLARIAGV